MIILAEKMMNKGLVTGHVYSPTTRQRIAYWPVLYNLFIENFNQEVFRQIRCYFLEQFGQITSSFNEINYNLTFTLLTICMLRFLRVKQSISSITLIYDQTEDLKLYIPFYNLVKKTLVTYILELKSEDQNDIIMPNNLFLQP